MLGTLALALLLAGCSADDYAAQADAQVYDILEKVSAHVTGDAKTFEIGRPEETLRDRLIAQPGTLEIRIEGHAACGKLEDPRIRRSRIPSQRQAGHEQADRQRPAEIVTTTRQRCTAPHDRRHSG